MLTIPDLARRLAGAAMLVAAATAAVPAAAGIELKPLVSELAYPVDIVSAHDGTGRLFIVELVGRIRIFDPARGFLPEPFLDISDRVSTGGERGMWSVAFPPDGGASGLFFVSYADLDGRLVVARYRVSADPDVADPASEERLLSEPHPLVSHYGGGLQFGPDGALYVSTGDGGGAGDPDHHAQDLSSLYGKILRLDPQAAPGGPLAAAGNPFAADDDPATRDEIWAYGFRNPWKFSFDRATGDLYVGDVGQDCWEEVDRQAAGDAGGENYGWPVTEGPRCYTPGVCSASSECIDGPYALPILTYPHPVGCAVTGGVVYRGSRISFLEGHYVFGDWCSGKVWMATPAAPYWSRELVLQIPDAITAIGEDDAGELLLAAGGSGTVWRIDPPTYPLFDDDFSNGDASDWTREDGRWQVASGLLTTTNRRADITAPFPGCRQCTLRARIGIPTGSSRSSLIGWHSRPHTFTQLQVTGDPPLMDLEVVVGGRTIEEARLQLPDFKPGDMLEASVTWTGVQYEVNIGTEEEPRLTVPAPAPDTGTIGFRVRGGRHCVSVFGGLAVR